MTDNAQITLDPQKFFLFSGSCPRLDECAYGIADPDEVLAEKLKSNKTLNEKVADYFRCYYEECDIIYKAFGIDHADTAAKVVVKMSEAQLTQEEIVAYLKQNLTELLAESKGSVEQAFYKTLAYALAEIQDQPTPQHLKQK